jgi:hypothetical protein
MPMSEAHYEPLTPVQVESRLRAFVTELTKAQSALANARDAEVDAEVALAVMRDDIAELAPKVERGVTTVGERDDFIDKATRQQQIQLRRAKATRENAQDYLRIVRDQAEIVRSLGASVRTAYELAGVS